MIYFQRGKNLGLSIPLTLIQLLLSPSCEAERKEYARQSRASEEVMRVRVAEVKDMVHEEQISKKEIASGDYLPKHAPQDTANVLITTHTCIAVPCTKGDL